MQCITDQNGTEHIDHNDDLRSQETAINQRDRDRIRSVRSHVRERDDTACSGGGVQDEPSCVTVTFACDVCHKVCRSAAGLGSHRRVHRS